MMQVRSWLSKDSVEKLEGMAPKLWEPSAADTWIIVYRDLFNWFASYMTWIVNAKNMTIDDDHMDERIQTWKKITEEACNVTNNIPFSDKLVCNYSMFKKSKSYRQHLCDKSGGTYSEVLLNHIPRDGNGSSFDGFRFQHRGLRMDTDRRWIQIMMNKELNKWYTACLIRNMDALEVNKLALEML